MNLPLSSISIAYLTAIIKFFLFVVRWRWFLLLLLNVTRLLQYSKVIDIFGQRILGVLELYEVVFKNVQLVVEVIKFDVLCHWDRTISLFHGGDQLQFVARYVEDFMLIALSFQYVQILKMLVDLLEVNIIGIAEHHVHLYCGIQDLGPETPDSIILLLLRV